MSEGLNGWYGLFSFLALVTILAVPALVFGAAALKAAVKEDFLPSGLKED